MNQRTRNLGYLLGLLSGTVLGYAWAEGGGVTVAVVGVLVAVLGVLIIFHPGGSLPSTRRETGPEPEWNWTAAPPLGQMLVSYRLVSEADLNRALDRQRKRGQRLGKTMVEMGLVSYQQVAEVLEEQFSRRSHAKGELRNPDREPGDGPAGMEQGPPSGER